MTGFAYVYSLRAIMVYENLKLADNHMSHLMTKPTEWSVHPAKTKISLGIRPV